MDERVAKDLLDMIKNNEEHFALAGENIRDGNPSPGNKEGGLTTIEEKSLGCINKAGYSTINEVYAYGEQVDKKGLVVMDTPGQDIASIAAMVAGGAQIVIFTTGTRNTQRERPRPSHKDNGQRRDILPYERQHRL